LDGTLGEDAHAQLLAHNPLVDKAIRIARVIAKTSEVTAFGRINEFTRAQGHEVEVLDAILIILPHALPKLLFRHDLPNIFVYQIAFIEICFRAQPEPLLLGFDDRHRSKLALLETLVLTIGAAAAVARTFDLGSAVDTIGVFATR
jgi:hypothetical protein